MTVDYEDFTLFMSHVAHEIKRYSTEDFIAKYKKQISETHYHSRINQAYIEAIVDYFSKEDNGFTTVCDKYVLDYYAYFWWVNEDDDTDAQKVYNDAIPEFKNRGIIICRLEEAY